MAEYKDLFDILNNSTFRNRVAVAVCVAADTIRTEDAATDNHANRIIWAKQAFQNPGSVAGIVIRAVIIANKTAATEAILGASDSAIQTNVDAVVDIFAQG